MDTATLLTDTFTEEMRRSGELLTRKLDELGKLNITASFWLYFIEKERWKLVLATPDVRSYGLRDAYGAVQEAIAALPSDIPRIDIMDIHLDKDTAQLIGKMSPTLRTGRTITNMRFSKSVVNGMYIEDAHIYRIV